MSHPFSYDEAIRRLPGLGLEVEQLVLGGERFAERVPVCVDSFRVSLEQTPCHGIHPLDLGSCRVNEAEFPDTFVEMKKRNPEKLGHPPRSKPSQDLHLVEAILSVNESVGSSQVFQAGSEEMGNTMGVAQDFDRRDQTR
jgi:hypothetical protein